MRVLKLSNGIDIPTVGLGTSNPMHDVSVPALFSFFGKVGCGVYRRFFKGSHGRWRSVKFVFAVRAAIKSGYRLIDTSSAYGNEHLICWGIRLSGVKRNELFIITRVSNSQQYAKSTRESLLQSLKNLNTTYVDLYMFHWPVTEIYLETWKEMERLCEEGVAKSIGVANCHKHHLDALFDIAKIAPVLNEFEVHPLMSQESLVNYCKSKKMDVIGYTPIGRFHEKLCSNEVLQGLALKYGKSIPQIILRWHNQRGIVTIPRSTKAKNIKENINIFDFLLTADEVALIDRVNENLRLRYDPDNCDFTKL